jgi:hypothetical protein
MHTLYRPVRLLHLAIQIKRIGELLVEQRQQGTPHPLGQVIMRGKGL